MAWHPPGCDCRGSVASGYVGQQNVDLVYQVVAGGRFVEAEGINGCEAVKPDEHAFEARTE